MKKIILLFSLLACSIASANYDQLGQLLALSQQTNGLELVPQPTAGIAIDGSSEHAARYQFRVDTAYPDDTYWLHRFDLYENRGCEAVHVQNGYLFDTDGQPIADVFYNTLLGEPYFYVLESTDGQRAAATRVVPYARTVSKSGKNASVVAMDPAAQSFLVVAKGYMPGEKIKVTVRTAGERDSFEAYASDSGELFICSVIQNGGPYSGTYTARLVGVDSRLQISCPRGDKFFCQSNLRGRKS